MKRNPYERVEPVGQLQKDKDGVIVKILENKTYMPDSGMMIRLGNSLRKISMPDLCDLLIVVRSK